MINSSGSINYARRESLSKRIRTAPSFLNTSLNAKLIRPIRKIQRCRELNVLASSNWSIEHSSGLFIRSATHDGLAVDLNGKHQVSLWSTTRQSTCCIHRFIGIDSRMNRNGYLTKTMASWVIMWVVEQVICIAEKNVISANFSALSNHLRNGIFSWIHIQLKCSAIGLYPVITSNDARTIFSRFSRLSGNLSLDFSIRNEIWERVDNGLSSIKRRSVHIIGINCWISSKCCVWKSKRQNYTYK